MYQIPNGLTESDAKNLPVQILRRQEWPTCTDFNLDESQFEAFQAALTKQMVIIQGPPGTYSFLLFYGGTFVKQFLLNLLNLFQARAKHTSGYELWKHCLQIQLHGPF